MTALTIPFNDRTVPYVAEGGETEFDTDYPVLKAPIGDTVDVRVFRRRAGVEAELVYPTDFTISGDGVQEGATIILAVAALEDDIYVVDGARAPVRIANYQNHRSLSSLDLNEELNRQIILLQEMRRDFGRALKRSPTAGIGDDPGGWDMQSLRLENVAPAEQLTDGATLADVVGRIADMGGGDMAKAFYDPTNKLADAFHMDNMEEGATTKIMTATERADIAASKATLAGFLAGLVGTSVSTSRATAPSGWLFEHGQAVSRTTYAALFAAIGTVHGVGDGSTTFNLADSRGRVDAGRDDMGGSAAGRLTTVSPNGNTVGAVGGAQTHQLSANQNGPHRHWIANNDTTTADLNGSVDLRLAMFRNAGADNQYFLAGTGTEATFGRTSETGTGEAHNNVQPTIVRNKMIFTGVFS